MGRIGSAFSWLIGNVGSISALSAVLVAIVGGTWVIAKSNYEGQIETIKSRLEFYESTKDIDIPKTLKDFGKFVRSANAEIELRKLQEEYKALQSEYSQVNNKYNQVNNLYTALKQTVKLEETFTLRENQSHTILNGTSIIGISRISSGSVDASINGVHPIEEIGGYWEVGEFKNMKLGGSDYRVVLEEISETDGTLTAKFRVDKLPITPNR